MSSCAVGWHVSRPLVVGRERCVRNSACVVLFNYFDLPSYMQIKSRMSSSVPMFVMLLTDVAPRSSLSQTRSPERKRRMHMCREIWSMERAWINLVSCRNAVWVCPSSLIRMSSRCQVEHIFCETCATHCSVSWLRRAPQRGSPRRTLVLTCRGHDNKKALVPLILVPVLVPPRT